MLGWDTDQFPTSIYLTTYTMLSVLKYGGFKTGGVNFDAKVRRESFEPIDLFHAHIGGMDAFARGLKIATAIRKDGRLAEFVKQRYSSWDTGIGAKIESGKASFEDIETYMLKKGEAAANRVLPFSKLVQQPRCLCFELERRPSTVRGTSQGSKFPLDPRRA